MSLFWFAMGVISGLFASSAIVTIVFLVRGPRANAAWCPINLVPDRYDCNVNTILAAPELVHLDFNPQGIAPGYWQDGGDENGRDCWLAARWNGDQDCFDMVKVHPTHFIQLEGPYHDPAGELDRYDKVRARMENAPRGQRALGYLRRDLMNSVGIGPLSAPPTMTNHESLPSTSFLKRASCQHPEDRRGAFIRVDGEAGPGSFSDNYAGTYCLVCAKIITERPT